MTDANPPSEEQRQKIASSVMSDLYTWKITVPQQMILLDLARLDIKQRRLPELAKGTMALPDDATTLDRARHIMGITHALRDFFPLNRSGGAIWLKHTNKYFLKKSPLNLMLDDGLRGMFKVWTNLDCTQGWD